MQLPTLRYAAALAWPAVATAFLLPPDVQGDALEAFKAIPDTNNHWIAHLDCAGCPVAQDKEDDFGQRGFVQAAELNSDLVLDFATNDNNEITIGGQVVFPTRGLPAAPYTVKQVLREGGDGMVESTEDDIGVSSRIDIGEEMRLDADGTVAIPFKMEILGIEDFVVHVDTVSFDILRDNTGHVYISNPHTIPSPLSPMDASCSSIICRIKAQIMPKVVAAKAKVGAFAGSCMRKLGFKSPHPAGGRAGHHHPAAVEDKIQEAKAKIQDIKHKIHGGPKKFGKKPCPGKMGKHGHGHGHHHGAAARVIHVMRHFAQHILMPVMVGIAAGMAVSAFGMVIGQIVFMIYMRIKGHRAGSIAVYHIIENQDAEAAMDDEPLPEYVEKEDLPPYSDEKTQL